MISLEPVPANHIYQPNNVCPGCLDIFEDKPGAEVLCHEGLKDKKVLQCFMDKNCAEEWATIRIQSIGLNQDGSLDCYNCRVALDPTSILNRGEVDRLQAVYRATMPTWMQEQNVEDELEGDPPRVAPFFEIKSLNDWTYLFWLLCTPSILEDLLGDGEIIFTPFGDRAMGPIGLITLVSEVLTILGTAKAYADDGQYSLRVRAITSFYTACAGMVLAPVAGQPVLIGATLGAIAPFTLRAVSDLTASCLKSVRNYFW